MNNDYLYKFLLFLSNKSQTGNTIGPEEFCMALQVSNLKHFKKKIGLPEEYQPGSPVSRQSFEITQVITDDLMPFKVHLGSPNIPFLSVDADGYALIPNNFYYPTSLVVICFLSLI